jgi:hypothetical protein
VKTRSWRSGAAAAVSVLVGISLAGCGGYAGYTSGTTAVESVPLTAEDMTPAGPASQDASSAATAMLPLHAADIASSDAQTSNTDFDIAAGNVGASAFLSGMTVRFLLPVYAIPEAGPITFDALPPTRHYIVGVSKGAEFMSTFRMYRDVRTGRWRYSREPLMSPTTYEASTLSLGEAVTRRDYEARYIWKSAALSWWVVRLEDGSEGAVPIQTMGPVWVDGKLLEARLYAPSIIRHGALY